LIKERVGGGFVPLNTLFEEMSNLIKENVLGVDEQSSEAYLSVLRQS
jgi:hypothetical protein